MLGVPYSTFYEDPVNMIKSLKSGQKFRALSDSPITPLFVRNAMRAGELRFEGQRTRGGRDINYPGVPGPKKITDLEAIAKGLLGLQPTAASKGYRAYQATSKMKQGIQDKKRDFADQYVNALRRSDEGKMQDIIKEIMEWNAKAAKSGETWKYIDLRQAIKSRLRTGGFANVPKVMRKRALDIAGQWGSP